MKRVLLLCSVFLFFVVGVIWFAFSRRDNSSVSAAHLAPANSIFFVECRDFAETQKRWPKSDLFKIFGEPSVRRCLDYSTKNLPDAFKATLQALQRLSPSSIFFSCYALNREEWICGVHCSGDLRSWETQLADPLASALSSRFMALPASNDSVSTVTRATHGWVFGVRIGSWILFSPKPVYLQDALRRTGAVNSGLDTSEVFQRCKAHMPDDADFYGFATGEGLKVIGPKLEAFLPPVDLSGLMFAGKLEGARVHDTLFAYSPHQRPPPDSLAGNGLFLTTDSTLLYAATTLDVLKLKAAIESLPAQWGFAETLKQYFDEVNELGISFDELTHLVKGVELVLNEESSAHGFDGAFLLETRDPVHSSEILQTILREEFPDRYEEKRIDGSTVYLFRGRTGTNLVLGMLGQDLIATTGEDSFRAADRAIQNQKVGLPDPPGLIEKGADRAAESLRLYVDARTVFEKSYATLRPVLILSSALIPELDRYLDPSTLPQSSEISRHLSPVALTRRVLSDGVLDESVGTLTGYELGLATGAGLAALTKAGEQPDSR